MFGVATDVKDRNKIISIKKIAKTAYKCISEWKELRTFRNQVIAHNHRDDSGNNIYLNYKIYDSPDTVGEMYLLVFCIHQMVNIVKFFFLEEFKSVILNFKIKKIKTTRNIKSDKEIKTKMNKISYEISSVLMRYSLLTETTNALENKRTTITILK